MSAWAEVNKRGVASHSDTKPQGVCAVRRHHIADELNEHFVFDQREPLCRALLQPIPLLCTSRYNSFSIKNS